MYQDEEIDKQRWRKWWTTMNSDGQRRTAMEREGEEGKGSAREVWTTLQCRVAWTWWSSTCMEDRRTSRVRWDGSYSSIHATWSWWRHRDVQGPKCQALDTCLVPTWSPLPYTLPTLGPLSTHVHHMCRQYILLAKKSSGDLEDLRVIPFKRRKTFKI